MKTLTQHNPDAVSFKPQTHLTAPRPDEIVVYWANVDEWDTSSELLSETEQLRAGQYVHARDRDRLSSPRSLLRRLLSAFLNHPAHAFPSLHAEGKPGLNPAEHPSAIEFSLSHSHGIAAFAFTIGRRIGIDIEKIDPEIELLPLARQYFATDEASYLEHLDPQAQLLAFLSVLDSQRSLSQGLRNSPLDSFDTGLQTNQILDALAPEQNNRWSVHTRTCRQLGGLFSDRKSQIRIHKSLWTGITPNGYDYSARP
jgi:phosphopantetheinyl transferase